MELFIAELFKNPAHYVSVVAAFAGSICVHEYCHAKVATCLGDPTAQEGGFLTVNPLKVMGWMSIAALLLFGFSWGAVPVMRNDPNRLRRSAVSLAGPLGNLVLLALAAMLLKGVLVWALPIPLWMAMFLEAVLYANAILLLLNILPVPGLDGWGAVEPFLPSALVPGEQAKARILSIYFYVVCISGAASGFFGKATDFLVEKFLPSEVASHQIVEDGERLLEEGDLAGAFRAFREAAGQGNLEGKLNYGICLAEGVGCKADLSKACEVLSDKQLMRFPMDRFYLGVFLLTGKGCDKDERRAFELLNDEAVLAIGPQAKFWLGFCHFNGAGTKQDFVKAARLFETAAGEGSEEAAQLLGWENGRKPDCGVPVEEWLAWRWADMNWPTWSLENTDGVPERTRRFVPPEQDMVPDAPGK